MKKMMERSLDRGGISLRGTPRQRRFVVAMMVVVVLMAVVGVIFTSRLDVDGIVHVRGSKPEDDAVMYAILSGARSFSRRLGPATKTWLRDVDPRHVVLCTEKEPSLEMKETAAGFRISIIRPVEGDVARNKTINSWSHLARVREAWDHDMANNPRLQWLALVDDDTYVFPRALEAVLRSYQSSTMLWAGLHELMRIDSGDHGDFAKKLRAMNYHSKNETCRLPDEPPGPTSCDRVFCRACPSIPQGGAFILSRSLVAGLQPFITTCEHETVSFCASCGSQRLYYCAIQHFNRVGVVRHDGFNRAGYDEAKRRLRQRNFLKKWMQTPLLTFHGLEKRGIPHTKTLAGDFDLFYNLDVSIRTSSRGRAFPTYQDLFDLIDCSGNASFSNGTCI